MPRRHDVAQRGHKCKRVSSPTFLASAPDCFCVWTNIGGRRIEEGRNTRQGDSSREMRTLPRHRSRWRSPLKGAPASAMSTAGLIHENCRRSCPKARFQSTRKCRRSPFPTRTYTRYLPTSMLLQRGNKIGRFRELDIGACNCLPQSPGNCCISLAIIHARRIHLTGEQPQSARALHSRRPIKLPGSEWTCAPRIPRTRLSFGTSSTNARHKHLKVVSTTSAVIFAPMDFAG